MAIKQMITMNKLIQALVGGWIATSLVGCGTSEENQNVAGIDGSGDKIRVTAQGPVNGFGSVIVDGERYDTSHTTFYRRGVAVNEADFEVGDMVVVVGYKQDAKLVAETVYFEPSLSGRVEAYDITAGVITLLGQRVKLDADTVIGAELSDKSLLGEDITVSGWQNDSDIRATRIVQNSTSQATQVRGHVHSIDKNAMRLSVGGLRVDYSAVNSMPVLQQGDIVVVSGDLAGNDVDRILRASSVVKQSVDQIKIPAAGNGTLSGFVRNREGNVRFWLNSVEVHLSEQTLFENGSVNDLMSGNLVRVRGTYNTNGILQANAIRITRFADKRSFSGEITDITMLGSDRAKIAINSNKFLLEADTALVDLQQFHSRLSAADLRVGDYVVVNAIATADGYRASTVKRTELGVNDRKFDGSDVLPFDWGFNPGNANPNDPNENMLFSGRLTKVEPSRGYIRLSNVYIKLRANTETQIIASNGKPLSQTEFTAELGAALNSNRLVWINVQGDLRNNTTDGDFLWADKIYFWFDKAGQEITPAMP